MGNISLNIQIVDRIPQKIDINYTSSCLEKAIKKFIIGEGDIKARWREAFQEIVILKKEDFPKDLQVDWSKIISKLTTKEAYGNEGSFLATIHKMRKSTLSKLALDLYELYFEIDEQCPNIDLNLTQEELENCP